MTDIRICHKGESKTSTLGGGTVYINGNKIDRVVSVRLDVCKPDDVAAVTITFAVSSFEFCPEVSG